MRPSALAAAVFAAAACCAAACCAAVGLDDSPAAVPVRYRPIGCVVRGPEVAYRHGPARKVVALSFDDGPSPLTLRLVRMLRAQGAVATFFMLGDQVSSRYRALVHEELRDGDALGDHTWSHPVLISSNAYGQLLHAERAIKGLSGYSPCVFRPPYGAYSDGVIAAGRRLGLATVIWNVDPRDWALPGTSAIVARVLAQVQRGSIVLSHDGGGPRGQTLAAYPAIVKALRARGYRFSTVPQLLGFHTVYRRCRLQCEKAAVSGPLPRGSIVEGSRQPAKRRALSGRSPDRRPTASRRRAVPWRSAARRSRWTGGSHMTAWGSRGRRRRR